ncbi:MAG TPA: hypothetical protein ENI82_06720, partial [Bacteroidetes bacterium]|nr:hypothetical protein [Bacteroidota bacterium]
MNIKLFSSLCFLFLSISSFSQNNELLKKVYGQLEKYKTLYPQEKIFVDTDKPYYSTGETIWFKTYLLDGITHLPNAVSTGVYIELINSDNKIIASRNIQIIDGGGKGDFELADSIPAGTYLIRGYSNFMRNFSEDYFFYKEITILDASKEKLSSDIAHTTQVPKSQQSSLSNNKIDVSFFPEGGDLIIGMSSKIAIKAVNNFGNSIEVAGKIFDNENLEITSFKTYGKGLGLVVLKPELGKEYTAKGIYNNQNFEIKLPPALNTGYLLQLRNKQQKGIDVTIKTNLENGLAGLTVVGQMRGEVFCIIKGEEGKTAMRTNVPVDSLADGIAQFT